MTFELIFKIASIIIVCIILVVTVKYICSHFFEKIYQPIQWILASKNGNISDEIALIENNYQDKIRFYNFWFQVERLKKEKVIGAYVELGVYQGETARIIHSLDNTRKFYLLDTFKGFVPDDLKKEKGDATTYKPKDFANTSVDKVLKYINGNKNIIIHKGRFSETAKNLEKEKFALVNIDADLYNPIKEACMFFYPRLSPGGVMIIHDYNHRWSGAMQAVDEFVKNIPENLIEIPDMFGSVMIIKNK